MHAHHMLTLRKQTFWLTHARQCRFRGGMMTLRLEAFEFPIATTHSHPNALDIDVIFQHTTCTKAFSHRTQIPTWSSLPAVCKVHTFSKMIPRPLQTTLRTAVRLQTPTPGSTSRCTRPLMRAPVYTLLRTIHSTQGQCPSDNSPSTPSALPFHVPLTHTPRTPQGHPASTTIYIHHQPSISHPHSHQSVSHDTQFNFASIPQPSNSPT